MSRTQQRILWLTVVAAAALMIGLRVFALDSDPYSRLSWSSGLLTDEGFYIHNARNVVLFGTARTDQFNNMLIMPTLHFVQVAVFRVWGVGAVQARMISVVCSLLMLAVFFAASRRAFGLRIACIAALFLGLDHSTLLYNRMALMDTPGALLLVCAFYCWIVGIESEGKSDSTWLFCCGVCLALAFCTRGLAVLVFPAPFIVLLWYRAVAPARARTPPLLDGQQDRREPAACAIRSLTIRRARWVLAGLALVLAGYLVTWYLPHRQELSHANSFYLWHQLVPHTVRRLAVNLLNGAFGDDRGMAPFLMRHSPAQTMLVVAWFLALGHYRDVRTAFLQRQDRMQGCAVLFMVCWLLLSVLFLCFVSYSPSRYYVLFTPALALIAALAAAHVNQLGRTLLESRWALPFLGGYCAYHLALSVMHHSSLYRMLMVGASALAGVLVMCIVRARLTRRKVDPSSWNLALPTAAFTMWAAVNGCYMIDWLSTLSYNQRDAGRWLSANLPSDTILLGDVAPGLCMDNRFHVVNVIAGLCNDRGPVAMYSGHRRAIVILDGAMIESGWVKFYPDLITRERRIKLFPHIGRFPVGVYLVDERDL